MQFQQELEEKAFRLGNGAVPVQRYQALRDRFLRAERPGEYAGENTDRDSSGTPADEFLKAEDLCIRGRWSEADLSDLLPRALTRDFIEGMEYFDRKIE